MAPVRAPAAVRGDRRRGLRASARSTQSGTLCLRGLDALRLVGGRTSHSLRSPRTPSVSLSTSGVAGKPGWQVPSRASARLAAISMFQLLAKSVLLPRSVVLGAGVLLVPWFVLCASLARAARSKAAGNERVVFVGEAEEAGLLRADLADSPERPAVLVGTLTCAEAKSTGKGLPLLISPSRRARRSWCSIAHRSWTSTSWRRRRCFTSVARVSARCRSSTSSGWARCSSRSSNACR